MVNSMAFLGVPDNYLNYTISGHCCQMTLV